MDCGFRISNFEFATHPPRVEPQRHRGTEKTQSRPTSQTRRHEDTKASQSRPSVTEKPQITQIDADSPRGFNAWRGPGRRTAARDRWAGLPLRSQAIVAVSRPSGLRFGSAGLATSLPLMSDGRCLPSQIEEREGGPDAPPARRPVGGLAARSACASSGRTSHWWSAIARSPAVPPSILGTAHHISDKPFVSSCLRVCDVGRLCVFSVSSLCLCGSIRTRHRGVWRVSGNHGSPPRLRRARPRSVEP